MKASREQVIEDWTIKPAIQTQPHHHFCSVLERGDIEQKLHSSLVDVFDDGIRLDGKRSRSKLVEVIAVGPGDWVDGGHRPREVEVGMLCYVKERAIPFRVHLRKQNHYYIPMDLVMAQVDHINVRAKPLGNHVMTRELGDGGIVEERVRKAIMGDLPFHVGKTLGLDKKGEEADDIGCNKTRIEEVVAVGPGEFGGFLQRIDADPDWFQGSARPPWRIVTEPWYKTPQVKPGDLIAFSDMARPCDVNLAGKKYTFFTLDFSVCTVLDAAI